MIKMRGHHLLCTLTFMGRGYSRQFEKDFARIIARIKKGELIEIVSGPDMICASVKDCDDSHCYESRITNRDKLALDSISHLIDEPISTGSVIAPLEFFNENYRTAFTTGQIRNACFDCQWSELCSHIAGNDFKQTHLKKP